MQIYKNENVNDGQEELRSSIKEIQSILSVCLQDLKIKNCQNGIFQYFFDEYKVNPVNNGLIKIDGNSFGGFHVKLPNIIDTKFINDFWCSNSNPSFTINFKKFYVKINKYRIHVGLPVGMCYFNNWTLKGKTQDNREIILSEVTNLKEINQNHQEATIDVKDSPFVNSIQLIMNERNSCGDGAMRIRNIELFGYIKLC